MLTHYHLLGRTGLRVSPLALGAMTFNNDPSWGADKDTSRAIFQRYVETGGNFIDTANAYGPSEELLGEFLAETGWRDQLVLAIKFTGARRQHDPNALGNGRKNILASLDASLQRLHGYRVIVGGDGREGRRAPNAATGASWEIRLRVARVIRVVEYFVTTRPR